MQESLEKWLWIQAKLMLVCDEDVHMESAYGYNWKTND